MLEWNQTVRTALADNQSSGNGASRGGRVIAAAGAKGGVGTTVVASHLAWDAARADPNMRVCLVDLDVESGDVPSYLDVSHRVSIADLAKISEDLTAAGRRRHRGGALQRPAPAADPDGDPRHRVRHAGGGPPDHRPAAHAVPPGRGRRGLGHHHDPGGGRGVRGHHPPAGHRRRAGAASGPPPGRGLGVARRGRRRPGARGGQPLRPAQRDPAGHHRHADPGRAVADPDSRSRARAGAGRQQPYAGGGPQPDLVAQPARHRGRARRDQRLPGGPRRGGRPSRAADAAGATSPPVAEAETRAVDGSGSQASPPTRAARPRRPAGRGRRRARPPWRRWPCSRSRCWSWLSRCRRSCSA